MILDRAFYELAAKVDELKYTNEHRIKMLEEKLEKVIQCLQDWDGTGYTARSHLKEGLNWNALQMDPPDAEKKESKREHKRRIVIEEKKMGCLQKALEEIEAIADNACT